MRTQKATRKVCHSLGLVCWIFSLSAAAWSQTGEWTVYNSGNSGLPYNGVTALAIDDQGIIWVGTGRWWAHAGGGLARFDGTNWTVYNTSNSGLPDNDHVNVCIDAQGNIWSGTEVGLSRFDGVKWTVYRTGNSGMMDNQSGSPEFDDEGNAWIACGCLAKFDGTHWTVYHTGNSGLPNNFVTDVAIDAHGNVWACTFGSGVAKFDGQKWTVYNTGNSALPHNDVSFLAADGEGNVWAGTYGGGLAKFNGTTWIAYNVATSGLPDNWIWNLSVDPDGNVWAGTKAGLARFDGVHWTIYNTGNSGLPDNNVYCTAFGADGTIWIGTQDGGLAAFRPRPVVDFNGDGCVNIQDLLQMIESWGQDEPAVDVGPTPFGDGIIDAADLAVLMDHWGQEVNDPTLMANWKLDEMEGPVACDSAGAHDGSLVGNPVWQPTGGKIGGALQLDGVDDCVTTAFVCDPSKGSFSVFAWVQGGAAGQVIVSQDKGANWLLADPATGAIMSGLQSGGRNSKAHYSNVIIADGNWHRVGFTWDGSNRTLYVDGIAVAQDTQSGLAGSTGGLNLGAGSTLAPGTFWKGLIDDVRIYDRVIRP